MTGAGLPWEVLPPWKVRLLEDIQELSVERAHLLRRGYPTYTPSGDGEFQIQSWRSRLRVLDAIRGEAEIHARAVEVPLPWIEAARLLGRQGVRWADRDPAPPRPPHGPEARRVWALNMLADDVWHLEHMAAISAARRARLAAQGFHSEPDPFVASQFQNNMTAVWQRACELALAVNLLDSERGQLWGRTARGWGVLLTATVHSYDTDTLEERWRTHAWPGIEREARDIVDNIRDTVDRYRDRALDAEALPLRPPQLIQHAIHHLQHSGTAGDGTEDTASTAPDDAAVIAALPDELELSWSAEPANEPDTAAAPSPGDPGREP
ncbi:hypothetical protein [Nocardia abscessus]|uniref:hypothetical protein n=1 Tax=Nocardia abscessus TaxID=120957 RepID=UPI002456BBB2|nr:hypothetical protein [Nocardia abscessus]